MFYSGGAKKKNAIREILKFKSDEPEHVNGRRSDSDTDTEKDIDSDTDVESYSDSDSDSDSDSKNSSRGTKNDNHFEDDDLSNPDKNDYIVTLGSIDVTGQHHRYTFVDEELEYDLEEFADTHPEIKKYQMVIYKINTRSSLPFLEFLFYYDKSTQEQCHLPYYQHKSKQNVRKETDQIMNKLFTGKYRFKGYFHDEHTDQCFVFYEKYFVNEAKNEKTAYVSLQKPDHWLWVCTTEILYYKKYTTIPIDENVIDFFIAYPTAGILQATMISAEPVRHYHSVNIEAPTILYYGSDICYARNMVVYGMKREPIVSRYGPFYYFTTLQHSFYWACYLKSNDKRKKRESANGGISRYAVFTKMMKTAFVDDDYDISSMKKYTERASIFKTVNDKFQQTQDESHHDKTYDSIYSYDYDWTVDYDSIYNGYYFKSDKNMIRPVWCICDHQNFQLLSYHEVNVEKCPDHYDPKYTDYTLL